MTSPRIRKINVDVRDNSRPRSSSTRFPAPVQHCAILYEQNTNTCWFHSILHALVAGEGLRLLCMSWLLRVNDHPAGACPKLSRLFADLLRRSLSSHDGRMKPHQHTDNLVREMVTTGKYGTTGMSGMSVQQTYRVMSSFMVDVCELSVTGRTPEHEDWRKDFFRPAQVLLTQEDSISMIPTQVTEEDDEKYVLDSIMVSLVGAERHMVTVVRCNNKFILVDSQPDGLGGQRVVKTQTPGVVHSEDIARAIPAAYMRKNQIRDVRISITSYVHASITDWASTQPEYPSSD